MNVSRIAAIVSLSLMLGGCGGYFPLLSMAAGNGSPPMRLTMLSGDAALERAFVRVALIDNTRPSGFRAQALPSSWDSAVVRLHSTDAKLIQDQVVTINRSGGFTDGAGNSTTNAAAFTNLRPGNYLFQVALFTGANGTGTNAAVHTTELALLGGSSTALAVTMKTTDGADSTSGGTVLNTTVSDTTGFIRSSAANANSTLGGPAGIPVIVAGDTLVLDPLLSDSSATGGATVTSGGSSASPVADLDPGVLSRVVVSYARNTVSPTGPALAAGETLLTDWVRANNEPIRGVTWASLADSGDGGTWPAGGAATRTGSGTFSGTFNWNTDAGDFAAAFGDESALAENYRLIYRYYDNAYGHTLIRVRTQPLAVVAPASITLTVK